MAGEGAVPKVFLFTRAQRQRGFSSHYVSCTPAYHPMLVHTAIAPHVDALCIRAAPTCERIMRLYSEVIAPEDTEAAGSGAAARTAGYTPAAEALAAAAVPAPETAGLFA